MVLVVGRISTVTSLSYQQKGMAAKLDRSALFYSRGVRKETAISSANLSAQVENGRGFSGFFCW